VAGKTVSAREDILKSIRARRLAEAPKPEPYHRPVAEGDRVQLFMDKAGGVATELRVLDSMSDVPAAVADILRAKNMAARVHLPPDAELGALALAPALMIEKTAPGPDDCALAVVPYAIAETGTLAYPAREDSPASWHFRAGLEIAIVRAGNILPQMEDVLARIRAKGTLPHTINFVTGPSRTGDIEQTLELGAHGPKSLAVLIVRE
jgi:L-lactate dehydrogenase complex protein LldG